MKKQMRLITTIIIAIIICTLTVVGAFTVADVSLERHEGATVVSFESVDRAWAEGEISGLNLAISLMYEAESVEEARLIIQKDIEWREKNILGILGDEGYGIVLLGERV